MSATKKAILAQLARVELQAIAEQYGLDVAERRIKDQLVEVAANSRKVNLTEVLGSYSRQRLKVLCRALNLDDSGKEKRSLVDRLVGGNGRNLGTHAVDPASGQLLMAAEPLVAYEVGPRQGGVSAGRRTKAKQRAWPQRRAGSHKSEAVLSGSIKVALRQLALAAAGGYRGPDAQLRFTTHLLECFGWPEGHPPNAEIPRVFSIAEGGRRIEREVALWWPERRTLMEVVPHDAVLDLARKDLVRVCLQVDPVPQYVVLTNQRDLQLYDLARDRETTRLSIPIDDLPKYSEAFPFFTTNWQPGAVPKIVNVEKVSAEVAELVARLYRSVRMKHPKREHDVIRFTLQCITAMFAEDIGLLPKNYFTSLLYDGAKSGNVEHRVRELFQQMSTHDLPAPRVVPYFNGGLFTEVPSLSLGPEQVIALTKAAEANWKFVDPHIFGSVFQGIMDDAERHAQGAHYTAQEDIMRVVGPTIVEPWRKRIQAATSLKELTDLRKELLAYRVLDPACGSGNFLYVAFRELYRLDTELLSRMREFPSTAGKLSWNGGISARNFFGIDINPFAVELAKVTLNIAKKIAYDERKAQAFSLSGQVELDIDPSLPLDNLEKNIMCADALLSQWPAADAIIGNPPYLGTQKFRRELGIDYLERLQRASGVDGVVDLVCYWFRRAHDQLAEGGRAGLVGTSAIRIGKAREASLDYIVANGGTITNAVSSRVWPGEAALNVSMVNWVKAYVDGPHSLVVQDQVFSVPRIQTHLQLHADVSIASKLVANAGGTTMGSIFGHEAFRAGKSGFGFGRTGGVRPMAGGDDMLRGRLANEPDWCIYICGCVTEEEARARGGSAFEHLKKHVYPWVRRRAESGKDTGHYATWLKRWWLPQQSREDFFVSIVRLRRMIACSRVLSRPIFDFISTDFIANDTMQVFAFEDDYTFGIVQSGLHWQWTRARGGKKTDRIRYTSEVWRTFVWPQDPTEAQVVSVANAAREVRRERAKLMNENGWSLRALYQAADVQGTHPLKQAQATLDAAVNEAYGVPADQDPIAFLLELNELVANDEKQGHKVQGPGLPDHLNAEDSRWMSTDCIEPPKVEN